MNRPLNIDLPDRFVTISDNTTAKAFVLALGIFDDLAKQIPLAGDTSTADDYTAYVCFFGHPTHWILAGRFHGNADEKENGFIVMAWPQNKFPKSAPTDFLSKINLGENVRIKTEHFGQEKPPQS